MTYNFQNYAILCDTWQQMLHLAKLAKAQGYETDNDSFNEELFDLGQVHFMVFDGGYFCDYYQYIGVKIEIPYTSFINSHPDLRVEGC